MKWIKCSERFPKNWNEVIIRNTDNKSIVTASLIHHILMFNQDRKTDGLETIDPDWEHMEWLDESRNPDTERILCAALLYRGMIIAGHRHSDCYKTITNLYVLFTADSIPITGLPERKDQGFLTSHNRFVTRAEAWEIAKANDQIAFGKDSSDDFLISENL